ncbi:MAG: hypothetical protein HQL14_05900 [Candidatus Omnitrophica bacterium]|nr:hypothetical protein [Candidatus Omnitrophota bacterium]
MKSIFLYFGAGVLVLVITVLIAVGLYIGPIVKIGMEKIGPQITQVSIKVDAVDISLLTGGAQVKGLVVGNPKGYKNSQAISVGAMTVSVAPFSVLSNKIVVRRVQVKSPEITFEGGLSRNNLSKIMDNVNAQAQKMGVAPSNKPAPKIEVDDFLITGAKVHVSLTGLSSQGMTLPLPDIHLTDLGRDSNGLTPAELTRAVLNAIDSDTIKVVTSAVTGLASGVTSLGKQTGQTVVQSVSKVTSTLGGLFGK